MTADGHLQQLVHRYRAPTGSAGPRGAERTWQTQQTCVPWTRRLTGRCTSGSGATAIPSPTPAVCLGCDRLSSEHGALAGPDGGVKVVSASETNLQELLEGARQYRVPLYQ